MFSAIAHSLPACGTMFVFGEWFGSGGSTKRSDFAFRPPWA